MPLPPDYHMHTPLCQHAVGLPTEYAAVAQRLGLGEIGFSDHSPMRQNDFDNWRMRADQLDQYVEDVEKARRDYPDLTIRLGLEVDYLPGQEEWIRELRAKFSWDYFIGSVHYVSDSWDLDNPQKLSMWKERDPDEVWAVYFERLTMAVESGLFQIVGHADLAKKFCFYPRKDCTAIFARFLDAVARAGMAIELNTAGLRKDCREIYPSRTIVLMARERRIPITFGSDAHAPGEVGMDFAAAIDLAKSCGFTHGVRIEKGEFFDVPLG